MLAKHTQGKKLLLVIDMQNGWRHKTATEAAMLATVELCRRFDGDIVHCCFRNDPDSLFYSQLHWKRFNDAADTDQITEIMPLNLPVYWRSTYSCLTPELVPLVQKYSAVYIAGVFTDISVASTAMNLFDMNIPVYVVRDCVATLHGEDVHEVSLKSIEMAIGARNVITADSI